MKRVNLLNSLSGAAQTIINVGLLMITIPVFINRLGLVTYGLYALILTIGNLGIFTNFGFNTSLIKHLAEQERSEESNYDIVVSLIIIGGTTIVLAGAAILFREFILGHVLNVDSAVTTPDVRLFYLTAVGTTVFQILGQIPSAVIDSQQKVYITNGVQLGAGVVSKGLILASLFIAPNLAVIGWIMLFTSFGGLCSLSWFALKTWGPLSCPNLMARMAPVARKHFTYGRSIYGSSLLGFFYEPATKILISHFIGLTEVGFFDIALRMRGLIGSILDRMLYPLLPLVAKKSDRNEIRNLIQEVQQKILLLVIPFIVLVVFLSKPVVTLWIGQHVGVISASVSAIVSVNLIALVFLPAYQFLTVKGYPEKTLVLQSVNVGVNVLLFLLFVPYIGYAGAVAAYCIALLSSVALCGVYQWKILGTYPIASRHQGVNVLKLAVLLVVASIVIELITTNNWTLLIILSVMNTVLTIVLLRSLRMITPNDVRRYFGQNGWFAGFLESLLVKEA